MNIENGLKLVNSVKSVSRETEKRLTVYFDLLVRWQQSINLISPKTVDSIWQRHIADSMQCAVHATEGSHIVDMGSGAGFPGLVMAIVLAEDSAGTFDFIESNGKKCAFLNAVIRDTGIRGDGLNVKVHHGRIEEILPTLDIPDIVSARALAPLKDLLDMTAPCLTRGCVGLFPKGRDHRNEIDEARESWFFNIELERSNLASDSVLLKISDLREL